MIVIVHQTDTSVTQCGKCTFWTEIMILESWCPHNKCCPVLEWKSFYLNLSDNTNTGCKTLGFVLSFCLLYHTLSYQSHHALSYHLYQTLSYHVIPYQDTQHTPAVEYQLESISFPFVCIGINSSHTIESCGKNDKLFHRFFFKGFFILCLSFLKHWGEVAGTILTIYFAKKNSLSHCRSYYHFLNAK